MRKAKNEKKEYLLDTKLVFYSSKTNKINHKKYRSEFLNSPLLSELLYLRNFFLWLIVKGNDYQKRKPATKRAVALN